MTRNTIKHLEKGLTLIEVLVAFLVLSIGLLGIAGLQLTSLRENKNAHYRTQAIYLANDMADRMRANPTGDYSDVDSTENDYSQKGCNDPDNPCPDAESIVATDVFEWLSTEANPPTSIPRLLPQGEGRITNNNDGTFTITVMWDDDRQGLGTDCSANADRTQNLTCLNLQITR